MEPFNPDLVNPASYDVARIVDSLKELANHNLGDMTCDALKKQLKIAATKWKNDKLGPDGPSPDEITLKRLLFLFIALYDFHGESDPIVRQLCSTTRKYSPWFQQKPSRCTVDNCFATFDDDEDLEYHLACIHVILDGSFNSTNKARDPSETPDFNCAVCDGSVPYLESEIRKHLQTHQMTTARYAILYLMHGQNLFELPEENYWTSNSSLMSYRPYLFTNAETYPLPPPTPATPLPPSMIPLPSNTESSNSILETSANSSSTASTTNQPAPQPN